MGRFSDNRLSFMNPLIPLNISSFPYYSRLSRNLRPSPSPPSFSFLLSGGNKKWRSSSRGGVWASPARGEEWVLVDLTGRGREELSLSSTGFEHLFLVIVILGT
ncbi:hypothetical protein Dimus_039665 [Dionaea muscipula]